MNISHPIASSLDRVEFGFLSSEDILELSVKRITNPVALDALLHPNPGGLYDTALGTFSDNPCTTCHLDANSCPGHCGHIELPVHVYHCVFMDQAFRLLRYQCVYCHRLTMSRLEVNRFACKLRLIRYGLLKEAEEVENVGLSSRTSDDGASNAGSSDEETGSDEHGTMAKRNAFVQKCIARVTKIGVVAAMVHNEAVTQARRAVIVDFQRAMSGRTCKNCKGITPGYRKNRYAGVFRKPLNAKERARNIVSGHKNFDNPLAALNKMNREQQRKEKKQARLKAKARARAEEIDEAVADLESSPAEDTEEIELSDSSSKGEQGEEGEVYSASDTADGATLLAVESAMSKVRKRKKRKSAEEEGQVFLNASEVHASLTHLFWKEAEIMSLIYRPTIDGEVVKQPSADMFFVKHMLVPPNKYRKEQKTGPEEISEAADNEAYRKILQGSEEILQIRRELQGESSETRTRPRNFNDLQNAWLRLQDSVNSLIDQDKSTVSGPAADKLPKGIKQKLEKKEGMFRMNIMGKRVNFAARSVISPDPNIETNEIGVPPVFAKKLTYPEPVTSASFDELKQAVKNGPTKWPGAVAIEDEHGQVISLRSKTDEERTALANLLLAPSNTNVTGTRNKKVHRHLNNGDIVIMNRQPTLHKPSMMCHRAKVLRGEKTIRMHYANCNTYNADFDGDEMNMHFPQNEIARAEALQIADTDHQYLSATAGKPLRGLIQDHISMSLWLTCQDTYFNRDEYQELLYSAMRPENNHTQTERIVTIEPAILKPRPTWTGKQVIDTVLENIRPPSHAKINLLSKSLTPSDRWGTFSQENEVRVEAGQLLTGILDKKQIGPSTGGLVHTVYEAYGHTIAGKFLSTLGRLLTKLLNMRAFSCGVEDLLLTDKGEADRRRILGGTSDVGLQVASRYVLLEDQKPDADNSELLARLEGVMRDDAKQAGLDAVVKVAAADLTSAITKACLPLGLAKEFPKNQMQTMTTSGAKGSVVNANQISCGLGQQVLEGRRVPTMVSGKTLPAFKPFESSIRAGGFIGDRFLTGVRPQEYFFHAMSGREGLIDTAVKTARSGYLQRCLVKGLEGLRAEYDSTVRDSDGSIIQSLYGEDGLDVTKSQSVMDFRFLSKNFLSIFAALRFRQDFEAVASSQARDWSKGATKRVERTNNIAAMDTAVSIYPPNRHAGSTSELFYKAAKSYVDTNPDRSIRIKGDVATAAFPSKTIFRNLLDLNYLRAVVDPGEAVGVVAAQSLGEPSTQMTLNTFHLAGHAAKNVTLGIPRLREILMTASMVIKTPTMSLYPIEEMSKEHTARFAKGISRVSLAEIVDDVSVEELVAKGSNHTDARIYNIRLGFYRFEEVEKEHAITLGDISRTIEFKFLFGLRKLIRAEFKKRGQEKSLKTASKSDALPEIGKSSRRIRNEEPIRAADNEGGDSDSDDGRDVDATDTKNKTNQDEGTTYEDPDEEEEEIAQAGEREASPEVQSESEDSTYGGSPKGPETESSEDESVTQEEEQSQKSRSKQASKDREERIKRKFPDIVDFKFDDNGGKFCNITFEYDSRTAKLLLLTLVTRAAHSALIQNIPGIASCTLTHEDPNKTPVVLTEGVNLLAMRDYQHVVNPHRMLTNDIGAMLRLYGVEAARSTIVAEVGAVFKGHSIDVNYRHLSLVADYMTRGGGYAPFSRNGMRDKTSAFAKMSFETTVGFLRDAVCDGATELLGSPSARITVGKIGKMGTGMFDVMMPLEVSPDIMDVDDELHGNGTEVNELMTDRACY